MDAPDTSRRSLFSACFDAACRVINALTGLAALLCMVAFGMALAVGPAFTDEVDGRKQVLR